ncbi:Protein of unknown function [Desulfurobacterium pacificum]|uniref:DUF3108 domain-containing protein n=1 Tax=Desulfurobacterium pacificum TaxID=240166 RepID=A0ABY1NR15_9BACT|nr:Protein of unknown function [Desulfurobacterium pacificum]
MKKVIGFTVTATLCLSFSAYAAYKPELKISKNPSNYDFDGEVLKYRLYWTIFHVADSESRAEKLPDGLYKFYGSVSTAGVAAWFKKIEDSGYSVWNPKTLCPVKTVIVQKEGHYIRKKVYIYDLDNGTVTYEKIHPTTGKIQKKLIKIPVKPFEDLVTATFFFRKYGIFKVGEETIFPLFAGGKFQNVSFKVVAKQKIDTLMGKLEAYKVIPSNNLSPEGAFKRTGKVVFWFTADKRHIPIKIEAQVAIGSVSAVLVDAKGKNFDLRKEAEKQQEKNLMERMLQGIFGGD